MNNSKILNEAVGKMILSWVKKKKQEKKFIFNFRKI
jgi:hypothetical protein